MLEAEDARSVPLVKSAARVLDMFEYLAANDGGATLADMRRALGFPASSCHTLLQTLLQRGYIVRDEWQGTYRLSHKLASLALSHYDVDLIEQAAPVMETVFRFCGQSISLAVPYEHDMLIIFKKTSKARIRIVNPVGTKLPIHACALGKAILAMWPPERLEAWLAGRVLERCTPHTMTSSDELRKSLAEIRMTNLAYDREESCEAIFAIGSAIFDREGSPIAALSIQTLPGHRPGDDAYWEKLSQILVAAANTIGVAMGCTKIQQPASLSLLGSTCIPI